MNEWKVLLAPSLARDPTLITSIRYLATGLHFFLRRGGHAIIFSDKKNGFRNFVLSVMVEMGVHKKGDGLDPDGLKAKLVFGITQLIYTLITISPVSIYSDFFIMIYPYFLSTSDPFLLLLLRLVLWLDGTCLQLGNVEWSLLLY